MATGRVRRVLCASDPRGDAAAVERLLDMAGEHGAQMIALVGNLGGDGGGLGSILGVVGSAGLPAFWVPGPDDAPVGDCLREGYNAEVVFSQLHGVHGTAAFASAHVLVAGFGGDIDDDPGASREEIERLRYPRWEPEYRLKILKELRDYELVLLFSMPPAHKGLGTPGSETVAELIGTYRPRVAVCGGERGAESIGRSAIVAPGSLGDGHYAIADVQSREVELLELPAARAGAGT
jgi:Icc-related predicted phosphoesterase